MSNPDYSTALTVDRSLEETFRAINNRREWWNDGIEGHTDKVGGVFTYRYGTFHTSKQKVTELVPGKRVVWDIIEGSPKFVEVKSEWKGTRVIFDTTKKVNHTEVRFTHQGLIPRLECYNSCTDAWGPIIKDCLRSLITTGKGVVG